MIESTIVSQVEFAIERIVIGKRRRSLGDIIPLAQSIKAVGLLHPIAILPNGTLIYGYHRLEACKSLGWTTISVIIRDWKELNAELAEIDENIIHNDMTQIELSRHLQRRKEIYDALHDGTKQESKGEWDNDKTTKIEAKEFTVSSFTKDTVTKTKLAERTIREKLQIAKYISPDLDAAILATPMANNQRELLKLARTEPDRQKAIIDQITDEQNRVKSIRQNVVTMEKERHEAIAESRVSHEKYEVYPYAVADLHNYVAANSIDAIITDPPYPREFLSVYTDLAEFAAYALKPGGSLITMVGQSYLPEIIDMLRAQLTYHWVACYYMPGDTTKLWHRNIGASWKPLLWFVKGKYTGAWVKDVVFMGRKKDKKHHEWGQPVEDMEAIIEHFTLPGQLICDPFVGGGSTAVAALLQKRYFVGSDIDLSWVQTTKQRMQDVLTQQLKEETEQMV